MLMQPHPIIVAHKNAHQAHVVMAQIVGVFEYYFWCTSTLYIHDFYYSQCTVYCN